MLCLSGFDLYSRWVPLTGSRDGRKCVKFCVIQLEPVRQVLPFDWFTTNHLVSGESTLH